MKNWIH